MAQSRREKTALVFLVLLIVLIGVCSCAYMNTARTWTVAASYVDDTVGSLDGYSVILYGGTIEPAISEASQAASADYEDKNACALTIDSANLSRYAVPSVYVIGGKRVGVFSAPETISVPRYNVFLKMLTQRDVDVVVCITPSYDNLPSLSGVDIVVLTAEDEAFGTIGIDREDTFIVRAPEKGSVGVILITSSNVVSSKVVDEI